MDPVCSTVRSRRPATVISPQKKANFCTNSRALQAAIIMVAEGGAGLHGHINKGLQPAPIRRSSCNVHGIKTQESLYSDWSEARLLATLNSQITSLTRPTLTGQRITRDCWTWSKNRDSSLSLRRPNESLATFHPSHPHGN